MDKTTETLALVPKRPIVTDNRSACLILIYPTGPGMGARYTLSETPIIVGRDSDCQIFIDDPSVSRRHVRIQPGIDGHYAVDLQSTNGTFVNDRQATMYKLKDGDYLRIGNWIFRYLRGDNVEAQYHEEIYRLTIIDGLTGIHNKRYLMELLDRDLARSAKHRRPLSLLLFDIDHFKSINDTLGHLGGDTALRELAACIKEAVSKEELFARYGGEEFVVVLPETAHEGAWQRAEHVRQLVEKHAFQHEDKPFSLTISVGVVTTEGNDSLTPAELIRRADDKLYQAKNSGRNCIMS